jgi:hypothetical protein
MYTKGWMMMILQRYDAATKLDRIIQDTESIARTHMIKAFHTNHDAICKQYASKAQTAFIHASNLKAYRDKSSFAAGLIYHRINLL